MVNPSNTTQNRLRQKREREEAHRVWLDALLNGGDAARITGMSLASVRRWRLLRQGPRYVKINAAVGRMRIPDEVMEYFRKTGAIGGKTRAKKHSKELLSGWGRLGGRPKGSGDKKGKKGGRH